MSSQPTHEVIGRFGERMKFRTLPTPIRSITENGSKKQRAIRVSQELNIPRTSQLCDFKHHDLEIVGIDIRTLAVDNATAVSFRRTRAPRGTMAELCVTIGFLDKEVVPAVSEILDMILDELLAAERSAEKSAPKSAPRRPSRELTA